MCWGKGWPAGGFAETHWSEAISLGAPSPRSVDFNTLEKGKGAGGQQQLGSVHTPADRLVGCVNDFFELFVS